MATSAATAAAAHTIATGTRGEKLIPKFTAISSHLT
jgi:hypothetical protein